MSQLVEKNTVVTLNYKVTDPDNVLVDAGDDPLVYLHGGYDDIFPKIEEAVQGKSLGDTVVVKLQPEDAFGDYDESLLRVESRDEFPQELEVGMHFESGVEDDDENLDEDFVIFRVTDIAEGKVVLDGNHPLAGMSLIFSCTIAGVRPASAEEIEEGTVDSDAEVSNEQAH